MAKLRGENAPTGRALMKHAKISADDIAAAKRRVSIDVPQARPALSATKLAKHDDVRGPIADG
jgi:hypothetical protein